MLIENFNHTIDSWIKELENYNFFQLCAKPSPDRWSLGQVYMHLISETGHFLKQMKICSSNNDNQAEEMSPNTKTLFQNNELPDELIEGPPTNADTPQPRGKDELIRALMNLKKEVNVTAVLISKSEFHGKTKHPGLNYLTANEWLQFAEIHLRHHYRQKKRIDEFLKMISIN